MSADTALHSALVTGANRGIGHEIARQRAHSRIRVVLGSRDPALGELAAAQVAGEGDLQVRAEQIDVADPRPRKGSAERADPDDSRAPSMVIGSVDWPASQDFR